MLEEVYIYIYEKMQFYHSINLNYSESSISFYSLNPLFIIFRLQQEFFYKEKSSTKVRKYFKMIH